MTIKGGIIETKEIGIAMNLNGEYYNTELVNGKISLKLKSGSQSEYEPTGYWISEVVNIGDNFKDFDKFISQIDVDGNSEVEVSTRTSSNGVDFNTWVNLGNDNEIMSPKNRYVQVRFNFEAGTSNYEDVILDSIVDDLSNFKYPELVENVNGLKIKNNFEFDMTLDESWTSEGDLYRNNIIRDDWVSIKKVNVEDVTNITNKLGTQLLTPEANWTRYNFSNTDILSAVGSGIYNYGDENKGFSSNDSYVLANFNGSGVRLMFNTRNTNRSANCKIELDGNIVSTVSSVDSTVISPNEKPYTVLYENLNLENTNHTIKVSGTDLSTSRLMIFNCLDVFATVNKSFILHDGEYKKWNEKKEEYISAVPKLTSNNSNGLAFSKYTFGGANYEAWNAFNGIDDVEGFANSANTVSGNLGYIFTSEKVIVSYSIKSMSSSTYLNAMPKNWTLEGSKDTMTGQDGNWVTLDTQSNQTWTNALESKNYNIDNKDKYKSYRLNVINNNGRHYFGLNELIFYEKVEVDPPTWSTVSSTLPTSQQFLSNGMDSLSPLLDRKVTTLEPMSMTERNDILQTGEEGKVFSKTLDLKKYLDIRNMKVEVK